jgi:hypothetical protein
MSPEALLLKHGVRLEHYEPGRHYTTCPQCSRDRSTAAHRNADVLGVTIKADGSVHWGCNHCGWTGPEKGNGAGWPPLAAYLYCDQTGAVRFRKVRNSPGREPRFWVEQPNGNGGWIKNAKGVDTSILYRVDEVAKAIADGRTIAVVEGEKDADRLWSIGIAATCNAHGASEWGKKPKWSRAHSEQLKGADIVVLNDNDQPGYAHAEATCKLSLGLAKLVRRLDLKLHWPGMPEGGDVSDWLDRGHTRAELEALIADAPPAERDEPPPASEPSSTNWPILNDQKQPMPVVANVLFALRKAPGLAKLVAYDELLRAAVLTAEPPLVTNARPASHDPLPRPVVDETPPKFRNGCNGTACRASGSTLSIRRSICAREKLRSIGCGNGSPGFSGIASRASISGSRLISAPSRRTITPPSAACSSSPWSRACSSPAARPTTSSSCKGRKAN